MPVPFMPPKFAPGPPTVPVWEDGPGPFLNPSNVGVPGNYNGQNQTALIVNANPKPPRQTHPGAAPPGSSKIS